MVIAICNEKGGSGKTNIAINLAIKLALVGDDTLLVDADPQRSIDVFTDIRADSSLPLLFNSVSKLGSSILKEIQSLKQKYDSVVIDTGGRDSGELRQALAVCDIAIIPVIPSDLDIAVLNKMILVFNQAKIYNPITKALIVISKASPNPFLAKKVEALREYISEKNLDDIFLAHSIIYEREAYRNALSSGMGVVEYCKNGENAKLDFEGFFDELVKFVNN
ncbi:AAA family ATPase [Campylobacter hyointestinalis]|uniref:AAA family ATPase n=1 Tax=Campylobacter hyointestinalis TaxID=198 RepID=UPI001BD3901D|nr:AAA family ATPase [Campylobacter hyointestinalis]MBT0612820.1 AAA family ATPase [Campylobacter hyointestinalis subsp. hyointestinalis]MDY2999656.1 AAA family ATPase [Campylobacter hyointestinalis]